jgi:hypothetical protein
MDLLRRLDSLFQQTCKSKVTYVITYGNLVVRGKIYVTGHGAENGHRALTFRYSDTGTRGSATVSSTTTISTPPGKRGSSFAFFLLPTGTLRVPEHELKGVGVL